MLGPILLQIVLIFLNAVFASAEIAVISMSEVKLRKLADAKDRRAVRLMMLTDQPARFLATIQVAITMAGLLGSAFAAESFAGPLVGVLLRAGVGISENILKTVSVFIITLILAYFNLVFGELVPKRIAMKKAESLALGISGVLHMVSVVFAPLVILLTASTNFILRMLGIDPQEEEEQVTEEEIRMLLMEGRKQGNIDKEESTIIQKVFEFDDITAEQVCTHRVDMTVLYLEDSQEKWEKVIHETRHTRYPICQGKVDDVIGILDTKDYFRLHDKSRENVLGKAVDKPYFVPENMKANTLFGRMKEAREYFAIIVDEYGGVSGIATLHDLVEALMGHIYEEEEPVQAEEIRLVGENQWLIRGSADISTAAQELKVELPGKAYDTFNGFVCGVLGRIPKMGEQFTCEEYGLEIVITDMKGHRIEEAVVRKKQLV